MKLWIDDVRPAPEGYVWYLNTNQALRTIRNNPKGVASGVGSTALGSPECPSV